MPQKSAFDTGSPVRILEIGGDINAPLRKIREQYRRKANYVSHFDSGYGSSLQYWKAARAINALLPAAPVGREVHIAGFAG